jgi:hypothetical protein
VASAPVKRSIDGVGLSSYVYTLVHDLTDGRYKLNFSQYTKFASFST